MAKSAAKKGLGTQFKRETPKDGGVYVTAAEVKSIGGPSWSRDQLDVTHMDSLDDHAEYIGGIAEGGEINLVLNFRPEHVTQGTTAGLVKSKDDGTIERWRVEWPQFANTPRLTFEGFITGWEPQSATKDVITVAVKVKVTGKVTAENFA